MEKERPIAGMISGAFIEDEKCEGSDRVAMAEQQPSPHPPV